MKQIKILLAGFAAMAISFVSCTNDFESANANPNELNEINPEYEFLLYTECFLRKYEKSVVGQL